jgi:hypothetical protein
MPIDAGAQPLYKRDPFYPSALQSRVHGLYTAEDTIYMHAYLLGVPGVVFTLHYPTTRQVIDAFERATPPDVGIQQIKALITLTHPSKQWARSTFGFDL